jgi:uronate dehydrogenase
VSQRPAVICGPFRFKERIANMKTVLITGAAGNVGGHLRRELSGKFNLRLSDIVPIKDLAPGEKSAHGDVAKMADMLRVTKGVDAIVHLGGFSAEGPWESILQANIIGCYNVFEAARRNGVKRVLFASSNHAAGFYKRDVKIDHRVYPKPDSRYGVSKAFGEQLGSLYADKYGLEVFCMRIGNVNPVPPDKRRLSIWISPRDLARLVSVGIENPNISFEIVYGVSDNKRSWYDNSNARRLGYLPQDDAEIYASEVLAKDKPGDPRTEMFQGGTFVLAEYGGDPSRRTVIRKAPKARPVKKATRVAGQKAPKPKKAAKPKKKK